MTCIDRTQEFHRLLREMGDPIGKDPGVSHMNTELNVISGEIGREIHEMQLKLKELDKLGKKKGIFDTKGADVDNLILSIQEDNRKVTQKIEMLSSRSDHLRGQASSVQAKTHVKGVVEALKARQMQVMTDFQRACETRRKTLDSQQKRRKEFTYQTPNTGPIYGSEIIGHEMTDPTEKGSLMGGSSGSHQGQQVLYHESRADAMQSVQKVIGELGVMFKKMADMIQEQEYMTLRIDEDITQTQDNMSNAERSLLDYFNNMSGNRSLILKVFGVVIAFVIFFVIFLS